MLSNKLIPGEKTCKISRFNVLANVHVPICKLIGKCADA